MVKKIVSGGQSGVDRAALDLALYHGIPCGGACPRGRWAEDGPIPARYPLVPVSSSNPVVRTLENVVSADASLVVVRGSVGRGSRATLAFASRLGIPYFLVDLSCDPSWLAVQRWLSVHGVGVLNVAGSRESRAPGIYDAAIYFLAAVLVPLD